MKKLKGTFDYSNTNWGTIPIISYYTNLQGFELEFLINNLKGLKNKRIKVLDLGCGGGNVCQFLKSKFPKWNVYGLDISQKAILSAKKNFKNINFIRAGADKLPFKDNSFDLVMSLDTLEHFVNYEKVVLEVKRILKPKTIFYLAVPLEKQFPTLYWIYYKLGWTAKSDFVGHVNFFNNNEILSSFEKLGFKNTRKTFGGHLIYSLGDLLYFLLLKPQQGKDKTFETVAENSSFKIIKNIFSVANYIESKMFGFIPGGRGHYFFKKI